MTSVTIINIIKKEEHNKKVIAPIKQYQKDFHRIINELVKTIGPDDTKAVVKIDFRNAFNAVLRDRTPCSFALDPILMYYSILNVLILPTF
jgi:hypothetical protein